MRILINNLLEKLGLRKMKIKNKKDLNIAKTELDKMIENAENKESHEPKKQTDEEIELADKFKKLYKN